MVRSMPPEVSAITSVILTFCSLTLQILALVALNLLTFFHNIALTLIPWLITFTTGQAENTNLTVAGLPEGTIQTPYLFVVSNCKPRANSPNYEHILHQIKHASAKENDNTAHKMTQYDDLAPIKEQVHHHNVTLVGGSRRTSCEKLEVRFSPHIEQPHHDA